MLAKTNRITQGPDYRNVVRKGRRFVTPNTVSYVWRNPAHGVVRFGFIVGKVVGTAPQRNLVRRRLKAVCHELLPSLLPGTDMVIRALPASASASWATLHEEVSQAASKGRNVS